MPITLHYRRFDPLGHTKAAGSPYGRPAINLMRKQLHDSDVLKKLIEMKSAGRDTVRAGEVARMFSVDSVRALGAMERVKRRVQAA